MKLTALFLLCGILFGTNATFHLRADQLVMQNGDLYTGKILSVTAARVELQSEVLGKVSLPRAKVANLVFGTNAPASKAMVNVAGVSVPTNLPDASALAALTGTDTNLGATASNLSANPELVRQVREQMLSGSPAAEAKYDELVAGFTSGRLNINDLRREAQSSADELRKLKKELGPDVGDSLDVYLEALDNFLNKSADGTTPAVPPKAPAR